MASKKLNVGQEYAARLLSRTKNYDTFESVDISLMVDLRPGIAPFTSESSKIFLEVAQYLLDSNAISQNNWSLVNSWLPIRINFSNEDDLNVFLISFGQHYIRSNQLPDDYFHEKWARK